MDESYCLDLDQDFHWQTTWFVQDGMYKFNKNKCAKEVRREKNNNNTPTLNKLEFYVHLRTYTYIFFRRERECLFFSLVLLIYLFIIFNRQQNYACSFMKSLFNSEYLCTQGDWLQIKYTHTHTHSQNVVFYFYIRYAWLLMAGCPGMDVDVDVDVDVDRKKVDAMQEWEIK